MVDGRPVRHVQADGALQHGQEVVHAAVIALEEKLDDGICREIGKKKLKLASHGDEGVLGDKDGVKHDLESRGLNY